MMEGEDLVSGEPLNMCRHFEVHTIGKGISTVIKSDTVPDISTPKSNFCVDPHSLFWTAGLIWLRAEKMPWSPQIAMKAVKKLIVHRVMTTIHVMM
jgi:hypothetical protein